MTKIKVSCRYCAVDLELAPTAFRLLIFDYGLAHYEWFCTRCHLFVQTSADERARSLLTLAQVPVIHVATPAEWHDPVRLNERPFIEDDVLDILLEIDAWCGCADDESARQESNLRPSA